MDQSAASAGRRKRMVYCVLLFPPIPWITGTTSTTSQPLAACSFAVSASCDSLTNRTDRYCQRTAGDLAGWALAAAAGGSPGFWRAKTWAPATPTLAERQSMVTILTRLMDKLLETWDAHSRTDAGT